MGVKREARIRWNESARVRLIHAVIQVEADILKNANKRALLSTARLGEKWERINNLLPLELQGTISSRRSRNCKEHKCRRVFGELLKAYRDPSPKSRNGPVRYRLTKPVREVMKKREDLLNAGMSNPTESSLNLRTPNEITSSACSVNDSRQVQPISSRSDLNMHIVQERKLERQSKPTTAPTTAAFLSAHVNESESTAEEACYFEMKARQIETSNLNRTRGKGRRNLDRALRSSTACRGSATQSRLAIPPPGPPSQRASNIQDPVAMAEPPMLREEHSHVQILPEDGVLKSSIGSQCIHPRASRAARKSTPRRLPRRHL